MDQRANYIRQDIESTRASLDQKLDTLESKARETFDLKHQVAERPWMALGAAAAAGYVLGSLGSSEPEQRWHGQPATTTDYNQHAYAQVSTPQHAPDAGRSSGDRFLAQFDDEIAMLKTAAITTLTNFLHDAIKEYVPMLGQQLTAATQSERTPASAPRAARSYGERSSVAPAAQADRETLNDLLTGATPADTSRTAATYAERERGLGADTTRY